VALLMAVHQIVERIPGSFSHKAEPEHMTRGVQALVLRTGMPVIDGTLAPVLAADESGIEFVYIFGGGAGNDPVMTAVALVRDTLGNILLKMFCVATLRHCGRRRGA